MLLGLGSLTLIMSIQTGAISNGSQEGVSELGLNVVDKPSSRKAKPSQPKLGLNVSSCSEGNPPLRMTKHFKSHDEMKTDYVSHCAVNTKGAQIMRQHQLWLQEAENKIKVHAADSEIKTLQEHQVNCTFEVDEAGNISNFSVVSNSGQDSIDDLAKSVIKRASPFTNCSKDSLVRQRGLKVSFAPRLALKVADKR